MLCYCGSPINKVPGNLIDIRKKIEWLAMDMNTITSLSNCCDTCIMSMSSDMDGEIEAKLYRQDTFSVYKSKFTQLLPNDANYILVSSLFNLSVSNEILRIEYHNNPKLLNLYNDFKCKHKDIDSNEEKLLFYGSKNINYTHILNDGFDISRSKNGLQGTGI
uniref:PARP catalytic domain-containing protein n=1 Tax=viral metagenome TaxID=1070528 RepID=A0A6C0J5W7_9ZZZZ